MDVTRRGFLTAAVAAALIPIAGRAQASPRPDGLVVSPAQAEAWLRDGNRRFAAGRPQRINHAPDRPQAKGQWPFAGVLGCSDSRATPDDVFDVAPSNIFTVRNAGNVVDDEGLGSLEFAVRALGISTILVLGHTSCGAVQAAQNYIRTGALPGGHIDTIVEHIAPAVKPLPSAGTPDEGVIANVLQSKALLMERSPVLAEAVAVGKVSLLGGVYRLATKQVKFI